MSPGKERDGFSRAIATVVLIAAVHAACFIAYQRADWNTLWTDQNGYMRLGRVLAQTGQFTRYPDSPRFIPEAIRTPGYPVFIAAVDRVFGESHVAIAAAQGALFAVICLFVFTLARRVVDERAAWIAALATALYPPIPYYGALALTEVFTTFLVTAGILLWLRALTGTGIEGGRGSADTRPDPRPPSSPVPGLLFAASGVVFAWTALTRPTFQFLPLVLVGAIWFVPGANRAQRRRGCVVMLVAFAVVLAPWILYNLKYFDRLTFTPAGGVGRTLFEGSWQAELPGRVENTLTNIADTTSDRAELDAKVRAYAAESGTPVEPMLQYVHQWQDIRKIWTEPQDPWERTIARIDADREYFRVGLENIRRNPVRHLWRRLVRGPVILWASEIPVRYSAINDLPPWSIRVLWVLQGVLFAVALAGVRALWKQRSTIEAITFFALLAYITIVHVPLYAEARYALPAKPVVLLLATVAVVDFIRSRSRVSSSSRAVHAARRSA